jgi:hypothetical protein
MEGLEVLIFHFLFLWHGTVGRIYILRAHINFQLIFMMLSTSQKSFLLVISICWKISFLKCFNVQVWDFKRRELKSRWEIGCSVAKIVYHRPNGNSNVV